MVFPVVGFAAGVMSGFFFPVAVGIYAKMLSVSLLAAFSSLIGGACAVRQGSFAENDFAGDFLFNVVAAALIVVAGNALGMDLYYVVLLAYGLKIVDNLVTFGRSKRTKERATP